MNAISLRAMNQAGAGALPFYKLGDFMGEQDSQQGVDSYADSMKSIRDKGHLRVGTSGDYHPFSFKGNEGLCGLDIEISKSFGVLLGIDVEFVGFRWPDLMTRFIAGDFDLVFSGINITKKRLGAALFSTPYVTSGAVPVLPVHSDVTDPSQLNVSGKRIVVNQGGFLEGVARKFFEKATVQPISNNMDLSKWLGGGDVDAILTDSLEVQYILNSCAGARRLGNLTNDQHGVMFPLQNEFLRAAMNEHLEGLESDGTLQRLRDEYGIK